jgi:hypothetical protein
VSLLSWKSLNPIGPCTHERVGFHVHAKFIGGPAHMQEMTSALAEQEA